MKHKSGGPQIQRILKRLPDLADTLRGSLLHRTIHHKRGCNKCASGGGHPVWILSVGFPGKKIVQTSLRPQQVPQVGRYLANYRKLRNALEQICELNRLQLRAEVAQEHDHD